MRDLLQARTAEQPPHEGVGFALARVRVERAEVAAQGEQIQHLLPCAGEAEHRLGAPAFGEAVDQFDVRAPVVDGPEAVALVLVQHRDPYPGEHLCDVLHHGLERDLEVPVEVAGARVVDAEFLTECHQRVLE